MLAAIPDDRRYTRQHEWARPEGDRVLVGITDYAQDQLGDVVYVDLPEPGASVTSGEPFGEVESTKSVADVYSPVSGTVLASNDALDSNPETINSDPYGDGWLVAVDPGDATLDDLMSADEYRAFLSEEE